MTGLIQMRMSRGGAITGSVVAVGAIGGFLWWAVSPTSPGGSGQAAAGQSVSLFATAAAPSRSGGASPSASPSVSPSASAAHSASTKPSAAKPKATPKASKNTAVAAAIALPPAPHAPETAPTTSPPAAAASASASASATCPTYAGTDAPKAEVGGALSTAAATPRSFSYTDSGGVSRTVSITAPDTLLKAIAWQESGWQSEIVACDGGFGTLQIMSGTATWMNNRFGTSYDYHTLAGNTQIGSEYVEWLIAYFGEVYYADDFDVTTDQSLLNDVIAAYNVGPGAVNPTGTSSGIPNPSYVANVEALATLQPWNG